MKLRYICLFLMMLSLVTVATQADAEGGRLRELLEKRKQNGGKIDESMLGRGKMSCADKVKQMEGLMGVMGKRAGGKSTPSLTASYGKHTLQAIDVYLPQKPSHPAPYPVIVMVHGGGWCIGDKGASHMVAPKTSRWVEKGFIFVSVNYRMLADGVFPVQQAEDVADALAYVQKHASEWNGDAERVIIMGHSAGAHIVSLLNANTEKAAARGVQPWLGTVSLDTAAMDIPRKMKSNPAYLYQEAFTDDEKYWEEASPYHQLAAGTLPWLGVCSSQRKDSCPDGERYAKKAKEMGARAETLPVALGHGKVNGELGKPGEYTETVEKFMGSLDPEVKKRLE